MSPTNLSFEKIEMTFSRLDLKLYEKYFDYWPVHLLGRQLAFNWKSCVLFICLSSARQQSVFAYPKQRATVLKLFSNEIAADQFFF
jgi:hypothetical protein